MVKLKAFWFQLIGFTEKTIYFLPKLLLAIAILIIGIKIINIIIKKLKRGQSKKRIDPTLYSFFVDLLNWVLKFSVFLLAALIIGIKTASFITIFGTIGLAVGLALQGTLTNVAGGVLLLLLKPIKVGDIIETQAHFGKIKTIHLFTTELVSFQNEVIIIPNSQLSNERIKNYSHLGKIRIDLTIGVGYESNFETTKQALLNAMNNCNTVLKNPRPEVGIFEYADSSIIFSVRPWCKPEKYWETYYCVQENIKIELDKQGIGIPFPQRVVYHVNQASKSQE